MKKELEISTYLKKMSDVKNCRERYFLCVASVTYIMAYYEIIKLNLPWLYIITNRQSCSLCEIIFKAMLIPIISIESYDFYIEKNGGDFMMSRALPTSQLVNTKYPWYKKRFT